jgi:hypothetical protein
MLGTFERATCGRINVRAVPFTGYRYRHSPCVAAGVGRDDIVPAGPSPPCFRIRDQTEGLSAANGLSFAFRTRFIARTRFLYEASDLNDNPTNAVNMKTESVTDLEAG